MLLLGGCNDKNNKIKENNTKIFQIEYNKNSEIQNIFGWVANEILLSFKAGDYQSISKHNLKTGKSKTLYKTQNIIVNAVPRSDGKLIAIHEINNNNMSEIKIINQEGIVLLKKESDSTEIKFYWNNFTENLVYVQTFNKDWSFNTEAINIDEKKFESSNINEPLFDWINENEAVYIEWNHTQPSITGPLKTKNNKTGAVRILKDNVLAFHVFSNTLVTFGINTNNSKKIVVNGESISNQTTAFSYEIDLPISYSEFINIPFINYDEEQRALYYFETRQDNKQYLVRYTQDKKEKIVQVISGPLICKDNLCLYGQRLDQIIDVDDKKVIKLIKKK
ncbi:MAG: hypothetical protein K0S51_385 [Bacillales bacterium]|jgi:hypothetical protein|nr:hypothetical protein [Bacillales bacterium]